MESLPSWLPAVAALLMIAVVGAVANCAFGWGGERQ